jgi:hypothetical protein
MEPNVSVHHGRKVSEQGHAGVTLHARRGLGGDRARAAVSREGVCSPPARPKNGRESEVTVARDLRVKLAEFSGLASGSSGIQIWSVFIIGDIAPARGSGPHSLWAVVCLVRSEVVAGTGQFSGD